MSDLSWRDFIPLEDWARYCKHTLTIVGLYLCLYATIKVGGYLFSDYPAFVTILHIIEQVFAVASVIILAWDLFSLKIEEIRKKGNDNANLLLMVA